MNNTDQTTALVPIHERTIIQGADPVQTVNARELHEFLENGDHFAGWIRDRIAKYGFIENQDFESFSAISEKPNGGRPRTEYYLTLNMAKELAMVENNERGRMARKYFIACEERLLRELKEKAQRALPPVDESRLLDMVTRAVSETVAHFEEKRAQREAALPAPLAEDADLSSLPYGADRQAAVDLCPYADAGSRELWRYLAQTAGLVRRTQTWMAQRFGLTRATVGEFIRRHGPEIEGIIFPFGVPALVPAKAPAAAEAEEPAAAALTPAPLAPAALPDPVAEREAAELQAFVSAWWETFGGSNATTAALFDLAYERRLFGVEPGPQDSISDWRRRQKFGRKLAARRDQTVGAFKIIDTTPRDGRARYRLEQITAASLPAPRPVSPASPVSPAAPAPPSRPTPPLTLTPPLCGDGDAPIIAQLIAACPHRDPRRQALWRHLVETHRRGGRMIFREMMASFGINSCSSLQIWSRADTALIETMWKLSAAGQQRGGADAPASEAKPPPADDVNCAPLTGAARAALFKRYPALAEMPAKLKWGERWTDEDLDYYRLRDAGAKLKVPDFVQWLIKEGYLCGDGTPRPECLASGMFAQKTTEVRGEQGSLFPVKLTLLTRPGYWHLFGRINRAKKQEERDRALAAMD